MNKTTHSPFGLVFICIFSCLSFYIHAQQLVIEGKQWNIELSGVTPEPSTFKLKIQGDTVINNIAYKKIIRSQDFGDSGWFQIDQYLREDDSKKVYLKTGSDPEFVLYDFSLNKGDFLVLSPTCGLAVTAVDMVTLSDGSQRKRMKVESTANPEDEGDYWIEGVGSQGGLLTHFALHCLDEYGERLLCHYAPDGALLFPDDPPFCFTSSIIELSLNDAIQVFPNPAQEYLFIENEKPTKPIQSISIFNTIGQQLYQNQLDSHQNVISLLNFPKGIYLLVIEMEDGKGYSKRIIKS